AAVAPLFSFGHGDMRRRCNVRNALTQIEISNPRGLSAQPQNTEKIGDLGRGASGSPVFHSSCTREDGENIISSSTCKLKLIGIYHTSSDEAEGIAPQHAKRLHYAATVPEILRQLRALQLRQEHQLQEEMAPPAQALNPGEARQGHQHHMLTQDALTLAAPSLTFQADHEGKSLQSLVEEKLHFQYPPGDERETRSKLLLLTTLEDFYTRFRRTSALYSSRLQDEPEPDSKMNTASRKPRMPIKYKAKDAERGFAVHLWGGRG
ncbi:unnamed protein product, partial [Amoebophrya sp. A25]